MQDRFSIGGESNVVNHLPQLIADIANHFFDPDDIEGLYAHARATAQFRTASFDDSGYDSFNESYPFL